MRVLCLCRAVAAVAIVALSAAALVVANPLVSLSNLPQDQVVLPVGLGDVARLFSLFADVIHLLPLLHSGG